MAEELRQEEKMQEEREEAVVVAEVEAVEKEADAAEPESGAEEKEEESLKEPENRAEEEPLKEPESRVEEKTAENREEREDRKASRQDEDEDEEPSRPKNKRLKSIMEYFQFGPDEDFSRDDYILARIRDEDLMEYLRMEREREREKRAAKEVREKRLFKTFELLAVLVTAAVIVGLLKDNPLVLVNILYIFGILFAAWIWKNPKNPPKE